MLRSEGNLSKQKKQLRTTYIRRHWPILWINAASMLLARLVVSLEFVTPETNSISVSPISKNSLYQKLIKGEDFFEKQVPIVAPLNFNKAALSTQKLKINFFVVLVL